MAMPTQNGTASSTRPQVSPLAVGAGLSMLAANGPWSERLMLKKQGPQTSRQLAEEELEKPASPAQLFFQSNAEKERAYSARHDYPRKKVITDIPSIDPLTGEENVTIKRRVMGFDLGFEKIFATTSVKLPVSAYTIFVELHTAHRKEVFSRCFNGMHTLFDLKKWIFETLLVPVNAYDLSYAEPGKATLTDQLRLLTTQDSLETRTLAASRMMQSQRNCFAGVHSIGDIGVTRLYLRLKCRMCGDLLNSLQTCRKFKSLVNMEPSASTEFFIHKSDSAAARQTITAKAEPQEDDASRRHGNFSDISGNLNVRTYEARIPGHDPTIEDLWYAPDQKKHCLFHGRGYEMYEAARTHGGQAELARIYISCGKEPSKKLRLSGGATGASATATTKISY